MNRIKENKIIRLRHQVRRKNPNKLHQQMFYNSQMPTCDNSPMFRVSYRWSNLLVSNKVAWQLPHWKCLTIQYLLISLWCQEPMGQIWEKKVQNQLLSTGMTSVSLTVSSRRFNLKWSTPRKEICKKAISNERNHKIWALPSFLPRHSTK